MPLQGVNTGHTYTQGDALGYVLSAPSGRLVTVWEHYSETTITVDIMYCGLTRELFAINAVKACEPLQFISTLNLELELPNK